MSAAPENPTIKAYSVGSSGVRQIDPALAVELATAPAARPESEASPPIVWIDITNPGDEEARFLRDELNFHPLAVEDCLRGRQRPKVDRYTDYFFLVAYASAVNPERNRVALTEIHFFVGAHYIVTVHDYRVDEVREILARWRANPERFSDVGSLAHLLLDAIVDDYFIVLEHFADRVEEIEKSVFEQTTEMLMPRILVIRHELVLFRRVVVPLRDVLSTLLRRNSPFLGTDLTPYYQDVHDHTIRVTEEIDALRELLSALLDAQLSTSANQLNKTMRMMTAWSIILMSATLIAGIYGMNFAFMPELQWRWGYFIALGAMLAIGAGLVFFFRRLRWL